MAHWDYIAKLIVIGDSGTGKSSLTIRLCENRFVQQHDVTIGVEFGSQVVPVGPPASLAQNGAELSTPRDGEAGQRYMKLSLWDTAGQETYKSITRSYFRGASGALLVFDISRRSSFTSVTSWLHDLRQIAEEKIVVVLVGNKSDLKDVGHPSGKASEPSITANRQVTSEEAWEWCQENQISQYVETSAKNGEGVETAFLSVAERIYENIEAGRYDLNDRRSGVKSSSTTKRHGRHDRVELGKKELGRDDGAIRGNKCC